VFLRPENNLYLPNRKGQRTNRGEKNEHNLLDDLEIEKQSKYPKVKFYLRGKRILSA
jgi:hypothetical protein